MANLATRFPSDLSYDLFFDSTVFVSATIDEVVRTLAIAIVLVALVVFVFLGRLRTTLIPLVAVPVSIIGTFAVMLSVIRPIRFRCWRWCWLSASSSTTPLSSSRTSSA
jgi:HAE1 family hydrophobic/amphiphilic exporter-1